MSNKPESISYGKRLVRTVTINGIRKFSATDICNILGYNNPNKILGRYCNSTPEYVRLETKGGLQNCRMITAEDIRAILSRSRRKAVPRLRRWLDEVTAPSVIAVLLEVTAR